ncbi:MAG: diacylglycerol/lipid kinase family protein, partial [Phycisphaerae bacterium]
CVVLNAKSGSVPDGDAEVACEEIRERLGKGGVDATVIPAEGEELQDAFEQAATSDSDAMIVAGGDGTVRSALKIALEHDKTFGVIPMGTFNLLARDLGCPLNWRKAIDAMGRAGTKTIDIAEINGEPFACHAVAGVVPKLAIERERMREESWLRMILRAPRRFWDVFSNIKRRYVRFVVDGQEHECDAWVVLISNNRVDNPFSYMPQRTRIDRGELAVYTACSATRAGVFWLIAFYSLGLLGWHPEVQVYTGTEVTLDGHHDKFRMAVDGEIEQVEGPADFTIRPGALKVLAPKAT